MQKKAGCGIAGLPSNPPRSGAHALQQRTKDADRTYMYAAVHRNVRPTTRMIMLAACTLAASLLVCATGLGAGSISSDVAVDGNLEGGITITDPTSLESGSSSGTSLLTGTPDVINLGRLDTAPQMQQARATWKISTAALGGYSLSIRSTGTSAPAMQNAATGPDFPDLCTVGSGSCPATCSVTACAANQTNMGRGFGIAVGDPSTHAQSAVTSTWGTKSATGTQGKLFGGIPTGPTGVVIAQQSTTVSNDPVSITFAARQSLDRNGLQDAGTYQANVRLTAITL